MTCANCRVNERVGGEGGRGGGAPPLPPPPRLTPLLLPHRQLPSLPKVSAGAGGPLHAGGAQVGEVHGKHQWAGVATDSAPDGSQEQGHMPSAAS